MLWIRIGFNADVEAKPMRIPEDPNPDPGQTYVTKSLICT